MPKRSRSIQAMVGRERGVPHGVRHFLNVYGYAKTIGGKEGLKPGVRAVLETAALAHDIGIKPSLGKYGNGTYPGVDGPDYRIPSEADLLVNMLEEGMSREAIKSAHDEVFETKTGKMFCRPTYMDGQWEWMARGRLAWL
ncbi:MAG: HD domain-containing protein [Deltaproteobacteria bacterium]|jgi:hypothetical protein|nr:HD domain-containing protein [Deltaproteobacteria bacterium]